MNASDRSAALLQMAVRAGKVGLWDWDVRGRTVVYSAEWKRQLGYADHEITNAFEEWESRVHPEDLPRVRQLLTDYLASPWPDYETEFRMQHKDGSWRWILAQADLVKDEEGWASHMLGSHVDITDMKRHELELRRANRMLRLISESNQTLIRLTDEDALLKQLCQIVVDVGGYRMAWVGLTEGNGDPGLRPIRTAALAGLAMQQIEAGRLGRIEGEACDPSRLAIRQRRPCIARNLPNDPSYALWRHAAIKHGYLASIALPLTTSTETFGALSIYAAEVDAFSPADTELLMELAGDLAFGLQVLRTRAERDRATAALQESERRLAEAERVSHVGYWEWDVAADRVPWSAETYRIFGLTPEAGVMNQARFVALVHPDDRPRVLEVIEGSGAGGPSPDLEYRIVRPDGEVRHLVSRVLPDAGEPDRARLLFGTVQDITDRKRIEEALRAREREFRTLAENTPDFIVRWDRQLCRTYVNPAFGRALGVPAKRLIGQPFATGYGWSPDQPEGDAIRRLQEKIHEVFATGASTEIEAPWMTADGLRSFHIRLAPEREAEGEIATVLAIGRDLTERKQAEEALHARELELRTLVENTPDVICRYDRDLRLSYGNPSLERLMGLPLAQLLGTTGLDAAPDHPGLVAYYAKLRAVFETGEALATELLLDFLPLADPPLHHIRLVPERDRQGRITSVLAIGRDISPLRQAAHQLRESERRYREIFDHTSDSIFLLDVAPDGGFTVTGLNPVAERILGLSSADAHGRRVDELMPPEVAPRLFANFRRCVSDAAPLAYEEEFPTAAGPGMFHTRLFPVRDDAGRIYRLVGVARDITEQKRAERALQASEHSLQVAQRVAGVGSWHWDLVTNRFQISAEAERIIGRAVPPEGLTADEQAALYTPASLERREAAVRHTLATGEPHEVELELIRPDGELRLITGRGEATRGADGRVVGLRGTIQDVTEARRAEEALRRSQHAYAALVNTVDGIVWELDVPTFRFTFVSPQAERLLGYPTAQWLDDPTFWQDHLHPEDRDWVTRYCTTATREGRDHDFTYRMIAADGRVVWLRDLVTVILENGQASRLRGIMVDVTQSRRGEEALKLFRTLVDEASDVIEVIDPATGRFLDVNERACRAHGYTREEYLARHVHDLEIGMELHLPHRWAAMVERIRQGAFAAEGAHRRKDGSVFPIEVSARFIHLDRDYIVAVVRDISARKSAEEALHARDEELRALVENTPDVVCRFDRGARLRYANPAFEKLHGFVAGPAVGRKPSEFSPRSSAAADHERKILEVARTGTPLEYEVLRETGPSPDAAPAWHHVRLVPERDRAGQVVSVLSTARDISALKQTELQLRTLAANSPDIIARFDREARYLYVNEAMEKLTGLPVVRFLGRRLGEPVSEQGWPASADILALREAIAGVFASGQAVESEATVTLPTGELVFNVRLVPECDEAGRVVSVLNISREVTARRRAEQALRDSEQRFRQVTENIDEVFWLTDVSQGRMIYISPAYERVWGRTCESLYAAPQSWIDAIHEEDQGRVREAARTLQTAGAYHVDYRIRRPDGTVRWIRDRAFPIRESTGLVSRIAGVAEDVTTERQLEEQFRQSQKMEAVGQLAGGIAHDFNNLLAVINLQSSLLLEITAEPATRDGIQEILAASERAANLTRQLLTFSRREVQRASDLDLREVLGTMTKLLRRVVGEDIGLETRFASTLPLVRADAGMVEQVLMNLVVNARDAMRDGGRLEITLDAVERDAAQVAAHPPAAPGTYVRLGVADTGCGIPPAHLPRIFEPFFTTKEVGKGTGLGLATVFGIVRQHHGWIEVQSTAGQGSRFDVFLPALPAATVPAGRVLPVVQAGGGSETILIVEDDPSVRLLARAVLARQGYRVLEAATAVAALEQWEQLAAPVDLVLTDLVMPGGMTGRELAGRLLARQPHLRVLYSSGYSNDIVDRQLPLEPGGNFLRKPYSASELLASVRRCLDRA